MLSLFFPNADALRLALASGIIPVEVASVEVAVARGQPSGLWVLTPAQLEKESLAALAHIGVRPFAGPAELPTQFFPCWSAALPLKRVDTEPAGPVLFELPTVSIAGFLSELARGGTPAEGYRLLETTALVQVASAPAYWLAHAREEPDSAITAYRSAGPNFWVEAGWQHLLPPIGDGAAPIILASAKYGWRMLEVGSWHTDREVQSLRAGRATPARAAEVAPIEVKLRLTRGTDDPVDEPIRILAGSLSTLVPLLESASPQSLQSVEIAILESPNSEGRIVLRSRIDPRHPTVVVGPGDAFVPQPELPRAMLPAGWNLIPNVRARALLKALALQPSELTWITSMPEGIRVHRFPLAAFRPLAERIRYEVPALRTHRAARAAEQPFALTGFIVAYEPTPQPTPAGMPGLPRERVAAKASETTRSRLAKWAGKLFAKSNTSPQMVEVEREDAEETPAENAASRRAALTPRERSARREALEESLFRHDSARPGESWAELAEIYTETGNPPDAALCWLHAIWCTAQPPDVWLREWVKLEVRSAKSPALRAEIAECIRAAFGPASQVPLPLPFDLKSLMVRIEGVEANLPCRMIWLARWAIAHLSGGDVLALARSRDRLFARMQNETALAAQDTPSFLRFRALAGSDRFPLARDWLMRCREPIQRWLKKQSKTNRLVWAGLDAEMPCTAAYADAMLAWGFAKLGDQVRTTDLLTAAESALREAPTVDAPVHARLLALFLAEIQNALRSVSEQPHANDTAGLPVLGEYALTKLVAHSRILCRGSSRSEFGSRPYVALLGADELGVKLTGWLDTKPLADTETLRAFLSVVAEDPTAKTLPRVIVALLELPASPECMSEVLRHVPRAIELLPEALRLVGIHEAERASYHERLSRRCVELACRAAVAFGLPASLKALAQTLGRSLDASDPPTRALLRSTAPSLFRALSRCGLTGELRELLGRWYRVGNDAAEAKLGAAIGWYTLGETERGNRILNDARERLFVEGIADENERTRTALAYAQALAHAPPRLALGRLEELFQRLSSITIGDAAARYFALKPLELIDTAITAIVNEDFSLGPEVRNWLDADELRIRSRITRDLGIAMRG